MRDAVRNKESWRRRLPKILVLRIATWRPAEAESQIYFPEFAWVTQSTPENGRFDCSGCNWTRGLKARDQKSAVETTLPSMKAIFKFQSVFKFFFF